MKEKEIIKIIGSIEEIKMDRDGEYTVKLKYPQNQKNSISKLENFIHKPLISFFAVEEKEDISFIE